MMANYQVPPGPITPPADFPVSWEQPDDERLHWIIDLMHTPDPVTPLTSTLALDVMFEGWNDATVAYDGPQWMRHQTINYYFYNAWVPVSDSPARMAELEARSQAEREAAALRIADDWVEVYLPEIQEHLGALAAFDLDQATLPELHDHLDDTYRRNRRLWEIHFIVAPLAYLAINMFVDFFEELFGTDGGLAPVRLLEGFPNKTVEGNLVLWRLSRDVLAMPAVRDVLITMPAAEVLPILKSMPESAQFRATFQDYLDTYGHRGDLFVELAFPSWIEDPTPAIAMLQDFLRQPERDLVAEQAALAAARERAVIETRERLASYPRAVRERFDTLLRVAQVGTVLTEDHSYWIDLQSQYQVRRVVLELGRRFAAVGALAAPDDVFYLTRAELWETATDPGRHDHHALVATRKAELAHFRTVTPPPALGTPPAETGAPPVNRSRFFGGPPPADEPGTVKGHPGSPGRARGPARVIRSLAEADRVQPGDVLVAPTTAPPWTPLFGSVAAVVTDTGGVLSHCAIVAREYGIPAVVGTGTATATIKDGQLVEVDGNQGTIRILTDEAV